MKHIIILFLFMQFAFAKTDQINKTRSFSTETGKQSIDSNRLAFIKDSIAKKQANDLLYSRAHYSDSNIVERDIFGLYKVKRNGKYGYITENKVIIPAIYDKIGGFMQTEADTAFFEMDYEEYFIIQKKYKKNLNEEILFEYPRNSDEHKRVKKYLETTKYILPNEIFTTWVKNGNLNYFIDIRGKFVLLNLPMDSKIDEKIWDYE